MNETNPNSNSGSADRLLTSEVAIAFLYGAIIDLSPYDSIESEAAEWLAISDTALNLVGLKTMDDMSASFLGHYAGPRLTLSTNIKLSGLGLFRLAVCQNLVLDSERLAHFSLSSFFSVAKDLSPAMHPYWPFATRIVQLLPSWALVSVIAIDHWIFQEPAIVSLGKELASRLRDLGDENSFEYRMLIEDGIVPLDLRSKVLVNLGRAKFHGDAYAIAVAAFESLDERDTWALLPILEEFGRGRLVATRFDQLFFKIASNERVTRFALMRANGQLESIADPMQLSHLVEMLDQLLLNLDSSDFAVRYCTAIALLPVAANSDDVLFAILTSLVREPLLFKRMELIDRLECVVEHSQQRVFFHRLLNFLLKEDFESKALARLAAGPPCNLLGELPNVSNVKQLSQSTKIDRRNFLQNYRAGKDSRLEFRFHLAQFTDRWLELDCKNLESADIDELQHFRKYLVLRNCDSLSSLEIRDGAFNRLNCWRLVLQQCYSPPIALIEQVAQFPGDLEIGAESADWFSCEAMKALSQHTGKLDLTHQSGITEEMAEILLQRDGDLSLPSRPRTPTIGPRLAKLYAVNRNTQYQVGFENVSELEPSIARILSDSTVDLSFPAIRSISAEAIDCLYNQNHYRELRLDGLERVPCDVADSLKRFSGSLSLGGLNEIAPSVATIVVDKAVDRSRFGGVTPFVQLSKLRRLDKDSASILAKSSMPLFLDGLERVDHDVAHALGGRMPNLDDPPSTRLSMQGLVEVTPSVMDLVLRNGVMTSWPADWQWLVGRQHQNSKLCSLDQDVLRMFTGESEGWFDDAIRNQDFVDAPIVQAGDLAHAERLMLPIPGLKAIHVRGVQRSSSRRILERIRDRRRFEELRYLQFGSNVGYTDTDTILGDEGVKILADTEELSNLRGLNLFESEVSDRGLWDLSHSNHFKKLEWLTFSYNHEITTRGLAFLAESPSIRSLIRLDLDHCSIGSTRGRLQCIAESENFRELRMLSASANLFDEASVHAFATSSVLTKLECIRGGTTGIGRFFADLILSEKLCSLRNLDLYSSDVNRRNLKLAVDSASFNRIEKLQLACNELVSKDIKCLCESTNCQALTHLDLSGNAIDDEGVAMLAEGRFPNLVCLILRNNPTTSKAASILANAKGMPRLSHLELSQLTSEKDAETLLGSTNLEHLKKVWVDQFHLDGAVGLEFLRLLNGPRTEWQWFS